MQHCGVEVIANAEQLSRINAVLGIEGEASGLHSPLQRGTGDIAGTGGVTDGELRHGSRSSGRTCDHLRNVFENQGGLPAQIPNAQQA
jgi:hypothetical protein